jgi:hypothetical protein
MITSWMHYRLGLPLVAALLVALAGVGLALAWGNQAATAAKNSDTVEATIDMTCFPPPSDEGEEPGIGSPPPCALPDELDSKFISPNPSGQAHLEVKDDGTTEVKIELEGLAPDLVITAWSAYYFPPNPPSDPVYDIFRPLGEGLPPLPAVSAPLAPTDFAFTEGLGREPNQFTVKDNGKAELTVELDYNLLQPNQGPLRNEASLVTQAASPDGSPAEQPVCCPDGVPAPRPQPIGASFLRQFDQTTGLPALGTDGRPELVRSPLPAVVIAVVVHIDETTHGISAGIPIPPIPGISATTGDHYTLGLFDLRQLNNENDEND